MNQRLTTTRQSLAIDPKLNQNWGLDTDNLYHATGTVTPQNSTVSAQVFFAGGGPVDGVPEAPPAGQHWRFKFPGLTARAVTLTVVSEAGEEISIEMIATKTI